MAGRNQSVLDHRGGWIFEGGTGLRGCWYHRTQKHNDVYNLQKPKEEISDSFRQITEISSTLLQGNILEEVSLFLHSIPNKLRRRAEREFLGAKLCDTASAALQDLFPTKDIE